MSRGKRNLLMDEPPLQVLPTLCVLIGLEEAITLQQLHYWLCEVQRTGAAKMGVIDRNGKPWIYNTFPDWQKDNFPFWSVRTVIRLFKRLEEELHLVETRKRFMLDLENEPARKPGAPPDHTLYYTINYYTFDRLVETGEIVNLDTTESPSCQIGTMASDHDKLSCSDHANLSSPSCQVGNILNIESETTRDNKTENGSGDSRYPSSEAVQVWKAVAQQLEYEMRRTEYDRWVKPLRVEALEGEIIRVSAEDALVRDWADQRLGPTINRLLPAVVGRACRAEFVLRGNV